MSNEKFSYEEYEATRSNLLSLVQNQLNDSDKEFLLNFKNCDPDWSINDFSIYPAIQWKLQNLKKLKTSNPYKHLELYNQLRKKLKV